MEVDLTLTPSRCELLARRESFQRPAEVEDQLTRLAEVTAPHGIDMKGASIRSLSFRDLGGIRRVQVSAPGQQELWEIRLSAERAARRHNRGAEQMRHEPWPGHKLKLDLTWSTLT
ncbi:MAG: hypothetical protein ACTHO8_09545 [Solirubrobacterales bacterium]